MIVEEIKGLLRQALNALSQSSDELEIEVERPGRSEHGDFSTNIALVLANKLGRKPRELADELMAAIPSVESVAKVEVAGPGFINFFLSHSWLYDTLEEIVKKGDSFGRVDIGNGMRVQVEFGSANPTGPPHVGNGRNIVYGDALASLLESAGFQVERENYINDSGEQINRFALSLEARYRQALGMEAVLPEDGYHGDYLIGLGKQLADEEGMGLINKTAEIAEWGVAQMVEAQRKTLEGLGVKYDNWFFQSSLETTGKLQKALDRLLSDGHLYEKEGATWFRASEFGVEKDRVLIRSKEKGGKPTYLAADAAYLLDKLDRGFERVIYFWGSDHHATAQSLTALAKALGVEERVEILIYQWLNLVGGRMSKRSGEIVTIDELVEEVGVDAARFTLLSQSHDSTLEFDFDLVKSKSLKNPVYYVQYAHARICSILRFGKEQGTSLESIENAPLSELVHESEHALIRKLAEFPEVIEVAAKLRAPYRLTHFAREVAEQFNVFYRDCQVIGRDPQLTQARLWLAESTRQLLANALGILGVGAPPKM